MARYTSLWSEVARAVTAFGVVIERQTYHSLHALLDDAGVRYSAWGLAEALSAQTGIRVHRRTIERWKGEGSEEI